MNIQPKKDLVPQPIAKAAAFPQQQPLKKQEKAKQSQTSDLSSSEEETLKKQKKKAKNKQKKAKDQFDESFGPEVAVVESKKRKHPEKGFVQISQNKQKPKRKDILTIFPFRKIAVSI